MTAAPEIQVEYVPVKDLIPYARNARRHSEPQVAQIAASIKEFSFTNPLIIDDSLTVRCGHGRLLAAQKLGLERVPCIRLKHLTKAQLRAYAIVDNQTALTSEWDEELLGLEMGELDFDFGAFDLSVPDIQSPDSMKDAIEDNVPEDPPTVCKLGDLWQLGDHRLLCGDCTVEENVDRLMAGEKIDMVFTDPPYGVSYEKKCNEIFGQKSGRKITNDDIKQNDLKNVIIGAFSNINRILKDVSQYYICSPQGGEMGLMMMMMMMENNIPCRHVIVWSKNAPVFSMGRLDYDYKHEPILYGWSPNRTHNKSTLAGQWKTSVWDCDREPNKLHPTMKPIPLIENAILNSCPQRGQVYDPFLGSGSTLIACEKTGRRCFGLEIDPVYCDVIIKRFEDYSGKKAVKLG